MSRCHRPRLARRVPPGRRRQRHSEWWRAQRKKEITTVLQQPCSFSLGSRRSCTRSRGRGRSPWWLGHPPTPLPRHWRPSSADSPPGAVAGTWILTRVRYPALPLAFTLTAAAAAATWASAQTGGPLLGKTLAALMASDSPAAGLMSQWLSAALLVTPLAVALGAAFPMALALSLGPDSRAPRLSVVYAVNTVGSVAGALSAGFLLVPRLGLQQTIQFASVALLLPVGSHRGSWPQIARGSSRSRSRGPRNSGARASRAGLGP